MSPSQMSDLIEPASPVFREVRNEHVFGNGELLSHVLMGDLVRYLGAYFETTSTA
jgi:hypothetical protein